MSISRETLEEREFRLHQEHVRARKTDERVSPEPGACQSFHVKGKGNDAGTRVTSTSLMQNKGIKNCK